MARDVMLSPESGAALMDELTRETSDRAFLSRRLVQANTLIDQLRLFIENEHSDATWDWAYEQLRRALKAYDTTPAK